MLISKNAPTATSPQPLRIGRRLIVVPIQFDVPLDAALIPLRIDAGATFGSGTHPTTRLCLRALERHLTAGASMVDLGTGSGILAIAAAKLGASKILGLDIDPESVRVAQQNVTANRLDEQIRILQGSLPQVSSDLSDGVPANLVVVNILAGVVESMLKDGLVATVKPGGLLVLAGMLTSQTPLIRAALPDCGLNLLAQEQEDGWVCMLAQRQ